MLVDWSVAVREMLSVPPVDGVKLTEVAKAEPPESVALQEPEVATVADAVELVPANVTEGAGVAEQEASFRMVVTGLKVEDGLTAVPTGEDGTETESSAIWPTVSPGAKTLE